MAVGRNLSLLSLALVAAPVFAQLAHPSQDVISRVRTQETARAQRAADHAMGLRTSLGLDSDHTFLAAGSHTDEFGLTHTHLAQHYQGVPVFDGSAITHMDHSGAHAPMTDSLVRNIHLSVVPSISASEALAIAHRDINPKGAYTYAPTARLVVFPVTALTPKTDRSYHENAEDFDHVVTHTKLAYEVRASLFNGTGETLSSIYIIDAHNGEITKKWSDLHTTAATGTGNSQYSGTVSLNTNLNGTNYELSDVVGNMPIKTYNLNHATSGTGTLYTSTSDTWGNGANYPTGTGTSTTSATGQTAAVDAHYGIMATSAFYKNVFNRNGIDNTGRATYSSVHYSTSYDNAFWDDTCFCMTYGDGSSFTSLEALDVAGHEMSHGVCANNGHGGLTYSGESGGLNEADSDIMGTFVVYYTYGAGGTGSTVPDTLTNAHGYTPWTIGSQLSTTPLRYMYKPSLDGASRDAWSSTLGNLNVHYSSGPGNRMIYFLSQGATTTGNTSTTYLPNGMTGIGNDHAARIWYRALTTYFTASMNYAACRTACMNAASDLYGTASAEYAAVQNAFHGINVGAAAPAGVAISVTPATASINTGATYQFTASVTGSTNTAATWSVVEAGGGSVSTSGLYTAPTTAGTYHVMATSAADTTKTAQATVTVTAPGTVSISITPTTATVATGGTQQFTASVTGSTNTSVTWTTTGGTVSASGLYTAPATAGTYTVKATSAADTTKSASATVTVTSSTGTTFNEVESNNSRTTANVVPDTATKIVGYMSSTTDIDYFKVNVQPGKSITINMTGPTGVDYDLYFLNSSGTTLKSSLGTTATETITYANTSATATVFYIKVIAYSGSSTTTPYNLALTR
jgi:Zn-dependent metalloprotease